jgi:hypothetical protein
MALEKSPQGTVGGRARPFAAGSPAALGLSTWWERLACWLERRPVRVRLALVMAASLALWGMILAGVASLFA